MLWAHPRRREAAGSPSSPLHHALEPHQGASSPHTASSRILLLQAAGASLSAACCTSALFGWGSLLLLHAELRTDSAVLSPSLLVLPAISPSPSLRSEQPDLPLQAFPHPLARLNVVKDTTMAGLRNQLSYSVVNEMVFSGLAHMINKFRRDVLQLPALRLADHGATQLDTLQASWLLYLLLLGHCKRTLV